jgi:hypothetical protein
MMLEGPFVKYKLENARQIPVLLRTLVIQFAKIVVSGEQPHPLAKTK